MTIGKRIRFYRKRRKMTLRDVAERTGLSVSLLSDVERGATMPSLVTCQKLANTYNITLTLLFSGVEIEAGVKKR